ncbi:MAG: NAD-dependent deacylase [Acidobacteriota bacterium]
MPETTLAAAVDRLRRTKHVAVLTGAGMSAESGIAPFRGKGGIWARYDPMEYATAEALARDPGKVWRMLRELGNEIAAAEPNAGHLALARLEASGRAIVDVVTQNVDGLHQRAGSARVIELHGSGRGLFCTSCGSRMAAASLRLSIEDLPPRCRCGGLIRPDVVLFGEPLPGGAFEAARSAVETAGVLLVVGTSAEVAPAAWLPDLARAHGTWLVEVNPEQTWLSGRADVVLRDAAAAILPALVEGILG